MIYANEELMFCRFDCEVTEKDVDEALERLAKAMEAVAQLQCVLVESPQIQVFFQFFSTVFSF